MKREKKKVDVCVTESEEREDRCLQCKNCFACTIRLQKMFSSSKKRCSRIDCEKWASDHSGNLPHQTQHMHTGTGRAEG